MKRIINHQNLCLLAFLMMLATMGACHKIEMNVAPSIDIEQTKYQVKPDRDLIITPKFNDIDAAEAVISWMMDDIVVGTEPTYVFNQKEVGTYHLKVKVITSSGSAEKDIQVDVLDLIPPIINFPEGNDLFVEVGEEHVFNPEFSNEEDLKLIWKIGNEVVSSDRSYKFKAEKEGTYFVNVAATNADGEDEMIVKITVIDEIPLEINFSDSKRVVSQGRPCRIIAEVPSTKDVTFEWTIDGKKVDGQKTNILELNDLSIGTKEINVTATKGKKKGNQHLTLEVVEPNKHYRPYRSGNSAFWNKVYKFLPAPGQFVNEGYSVSTMEEAVAYAEKRLKEKAYVSLGGFGGYIVLGFDHSILNSGGYDFRVYGNSFKGSSEPGIVWVMQDENGDGIPNDTWYELKGSETGKPGTIQDYEVTYYRPNTPKSDVIWTDNKGKKGAVDWLGFHQQDYYYPLWVKTSVYTLRGTCLEPRTYDQSGQGTYWVNEEYDWGYADNFSNIDRLTDDDNYNANVNANHFKISNAIDYKGKAVHLDFIDFIKVQTGVNVKAGWLGENSTEVFSAEDYHPNKTK